MKKSTASNVLAVLDTMIFIRALVGRKPEVQCYNALIIDGPGKLVCSKQITEQYVSVIQKYGFTAVVAWAELWKLRYMNKLRNCDANSEVIGEDLAPRKDRHIIAPCKEGFANLVVTRDGGILERKSRIESVTGARVLSLEEALEEFVTPSGLVKP